MRQYAKTYTNFNKLLNIGALGMYKAIKRHDIYNRPRIMALISKYRKSTINMFSFYVKLYVKNEIIDHIRNNNLVRIPNERSKGA